MEWSKIKNIIIIILVCVNVFLLGLVILREGKNARSQEQLRTEVVALLQDKGISFLPERVPRDMALGALTVTRDRTGEQAVAEALLGPVEQQDEYGGLRMTYQGTGGNAVFSSDGGFQVTLEPGVRLLDGKTPAEDSLECLSLLGVEGVLVDTVTEGDKVILTYRQSWAEAPLFSCTAKLTYQSGALRSVEGNRLIGTETADTDGPEPLDTVTVLVRFYAGLNERRDICSKIEEMTPGYLPGSNRSPVKLTPVWRITTDTGAYYVDGMNGAVTPAQ